MKGLLLKVLTGLLAALGGFAYYTNIKAKRLAEKLEVEKRSAEALKRRAKQTKELNKAKAKSDKEADEHETAFNTAEASDSRPDEFGDSRLRDD